MVKVRGFRKKESPELSSNASKPITQAEAQLMMNTLSTMRAGFLNQLLDGPNRDLNRDCNYPDVIKPSDYHNMYQREGIATRVVEVWPKECWSVKPTIYETEDPDNETEFETAVKALDDNFRLLHFMSRVDVLSGIGRYGVMLLGIDDGKSLSEPVEGVTGHIDFTEGQPPAPAQRKLLYIRVFDESVVDVANWERDETNPRFGFPATYTVNFQDDEGQSFSKTIHWTRLVHFADGRQMSEVYGSPRMENCYNRLLDVRKILSGSGEMFWKGAFPGFSFEVNQDSSNTGATIDVESIKNQMDAYMNRLQRYLALTGVSAKSLAPQVADPSGHFQANLDAIAITLGVPKRKFMGSEQAELASSQDAKTWNKRVAQRQNEYLTPMLVKPIIDRLIEMGVLPMPEEYFVEWPDLAGQTEDEQAATAGKWAEAMAKYVAGGCEAIIAPDEFFGLFGKLTPEEIDQIKTGLEKFMEEMADLEAERAAEAAALNPPVDPNNPNPDDPNNPNPDNPPQQGDVPAAQGNNPPQPPIPPKKTTNKKSRKSREG